MVVRPLHRACVAASLGCRFPRAYPTRLNHLAIGATDVVASSRALTRRTNERHLQPMTGGPRRDEDGYPVTSPAHLTQGIQGSLLSGFRTTPMRPLDSHRFVSKSGK